MDKILCSVEILTRNNADTIARCLESVKEFDDVMVVDGGSTDDTRRIAERYGARIIDQHDQQAPDVPITDFAAVRNRGLESARHEWFLYVDSDEYVSPEVVEEIRFIITSPNPHPYIRRMPRKYVRHGMVVSCSLGYPNFQTRFFHRGHVAEFVKAVHERIEPRPGEHIGFLKHPTYVPLVSLAELRKKARRYIILEDARMAGIARLTAARKIVHTVLVLARNVLHIRKVIFCRGRRLPFIYEWLRFEYHLKLLGVLVKRFLVPR